MSSDASSPGPSGSKVPESDNRAPSYVVVARRYRPKTFEDLVGQQHITQALTNAITTGRVGHAYLFTGARGVGKTSTARIFAKALNAPGGPTPNPDNDSDICQAIDAGEDVDVIEIDGASNRGIDEIRQLRANANVRPSRARYKIYIIDEVHMLTTAAFNALLKTLEEPPEHVKFIFCTTDPQKIPITVLSRCQRYDFAPVEVGAIVERLLLIVRTEGRQAEPEALQLLARRAEGSMRDSQSLLEQLLAYCSETITVEDVHQMLGTAQSGRLADLADVLVRRDAAEALAALDQAVTDGVDCGQLAEQLLGYIRDMMALSVGCSVELLRHTGPGDQERATAMTTQLGLETILAMGQILDQTVVRMRQSTQPRILLEIALVRICHLEDLDQLAALIDQFKDGPPASTPPTRSRPTGATRGPRPSQQVAPGKPRVSAETKRAPRDQDQPSSATAEPKPSVASPDLSESVWKQALDQIEDMTADFASYYDHVATSTPDCLVVHFREAYTLQKESCEQPERKKKLEQALAHAAGRPVRLDLVVIREEHKPRTVAVPAKTLRQLMREKEKHPWVREAIELFDAEVIRVDVPRSTSNGPRGSSLVSEG